MNFVFKWLRKKLTENEDKAECVNSTASDRSLRIDSRGTRFTVYKADGGHVVETHTYNNQHGNSENGLYIVTSDQDLGERLAHIVTYEAIKR